MKVYHSCMLIMSSALISGQDPAEKSGNQQVVLPFCISPLLQESLDFFPVVHLSNIGENKAFTRRG